MNKKYIIEIEEVPFIKSNIDVPSGYTPVTQTLLYKAKGFNSLVFDSNGLKKLKPFYDDTYINMPEFIESLRSSAITNRDRLFADDVEFAYRQYIKELGKPKKQECLAFAF